MKTYAQQKTGFNAFVIMLCFILCFTLWGCNGNSAAKKYSSEEIVSLYSPYVVEIRNEYTAEAGTGFVAAERDGFPVIITNYHVSGDDGTCLKIRFFGEILFSGGQDTVTIVGYDAELDISVLTIDYKPVNIDLTASPLKSWLSGDISARAGQAVTGLGNAFGFGISAYEGIVGMEEHVAETVNSYAGTIRMPYLITTAKVNGGSSGGPLINEYGKVIGVASNHYADSARPSEEISFAVPAVLARKVLDSSLEQSRSGNEGQPIRKLRFSFEYNVAEKNYRLSFPMLNFTVAFTDVGLEIISATGTLAEHIGAKIVRFGDYEVTGDSYTHIILEALGYSAGGSGKAFSVEIESGVKKQTKSFDEYKQN